MTPEILSGISNNQLAVTRDAIEWAYRLILGRPPECEAVVEGHRALRSIAELRHCFITSAEFRSQRGEECLPEQFLREFPAWQGVAEADSTRDFLGIRTRCSYVSDPYPGPGGTVEGYPGGHSSVHDLAEWSSLLAAVMDAREAFTLVELGAGWAPWSVAGAKAAQVRGISTATLVMLEADPIHVSFIHQHCRDNGIDPGDHRVLWAAVAPYDGKALFPKLADPNAEWGAGALFEGRKNADGFTTTPAQEWIEVKCMSLASVLDGLPPVDLVHCDIQGSEFEVIQAGIHELTKRVRRLVVGTHGREIEAGLFRTLGTAGWQLEAESPCKISQRETTWALLRDGVQVWINPRCHQ